jgi:hypothetical protein
MGKHAARLHEHIRTLMPTYKITYLLKLQHDTDVLQENLKFIYNHL